MSLLFSSRLFSMARSTWPTLGAGATVLVSVLTTTTCSSCTTTPAILLVPHPLGGGLSAILLIMWLVSIISIDHVKELWNRHEEYRKARAQEAALRRQKEAVLEELVSTGILSHMVRNPYTRSLPLVLEEQQRLQNA